MRRQDVGVASGMAKLALNFKLKLPRLLQVILLFRSLIF